MDNSLNEFLKYIFDLAENTGSSQHSYLKQQQRDMQTCPSCGTSYGEFRKSGLLGCADCYKAFKQSINIVLGNIHGSSEYKGKIPTGRNAEYTALKAKREIITLREQLAAAVRLENYEQAAVIRDRIRDLESELQ